MNPLFTREQLSRSAMRGQPDSRLVVLVRAGSDVAAEEIVRRYRPILFGYACTFVPADRAEDVLQESMIKALAGLLRSHDEIQLRPWLFTIVRNTALNEIRHTRGGERAHDQLRAPVPTTPEEELEQRVAFASMVSALTALPESQRRALVGHEFEGHSHSDLAVALNTTSSSIRGLIYRAREAVRAALGFVVPIPLLRILVGLAPAQPAATEAAAGAAAGGLGAGLATSGGSKLGALGASVVLAGSIGVARLDNPRDSGGGVRQANLGVPAVSQPSTWESPAPASYSLTGAPGSLEAGPGSYAGSGGPARGSGDPAGPRPRIALAHLVSSPGPRLSPEQREEREKAREKAAEEAAKEREKAAEEAAKQREDAAKEREKDAEERRKEAEKAAKEREKAAEERRKEAEKAAEERQKAREELAKEREKAAEERRKEAEKAAEEREKAAEERRKEAEKAAEEREKAAEEAAKEREKDAG